MDALFHQFGIQPSNIFDLQLAEVAGRRSKGLTVKYAPWSAFWRVKRVEWPPVGTESICQVKDCDWRTLVQSQGTSARTLHSHLPFHVPLNFLAFPKGLRWKWPHFAIWTSAHKESQLEIQGSGNTLVRKHQCSTRLNSCSTKWCLKDERKGPWNPFFYSLARFSQTAWSTLRPQTSRGRSQPLV